MENHKIFLQQIPLGAINVTYATVSGILSLKNETYGNPAEPEADFVPVMGFLVLEEGETTAAINVTVLEVNTYVISVISY